MDAETVVRIAVACKKNNQITDRINNRSQRTDRINNRLKCTEEKAVDVETVVRIVKSNVRDKSHN